MAAKWRLLFLLITCTLPAIAQHGALVYENKVYMPFIKTVQCYNAQKEQSPPVISLKAAEQLFFSFDDLQGGSKNYWYAIEHCTADWRPSNISTLDFVASFAEDRITEYSYSSRTLQAYTNYSLTLPNEQVKIKTSGNYVLKVYENGQVKKPILTQRFYVTDQKVNINFELLPSTQVTERPFVQKINFSIAHPGLMIQNPNLELKTVVMQNLNSLTAITTSRPNFIKPGLLLYNDLKSNVFKGGNEFRKFDTRSLRYSGAQVQYISKDSIYKVILLPDLSRNNTTYSSQYDENGNFFIRNQDDRNYATESDYTSVTFSLKAKMPASEGDLYVAGRFNNYNLSSASKLDYDAEKAQFTGKFFLKQGIYDYKYIWKDKLSGSLDDTLFEGSFFETENTYQVFVYFRKPGSRWDELIGYFNTQTDTRRPSQVN
jgi:hypothetical protein